MNLDYDVYKKSIGPKDLYHLMHFCLSSVMPVQASQSVVEPEGLYQNIIGFSDFLLGSAAVIGASAFDSFSQLHCPDQIGFTTDLLWYIGIRHTDTVRFVASLPPKVGSAYISASTFAQWLLSTLSQALKPSRKSN